MPDHLLEDHARVERDLWIPVAVERGEDDVGSRRQVLDRRPARADLSPEQVVEDLGHVLAGLELKPPDVVDEQKQEIVGVDLLRELGDEFRRRLGICIALACGDRGRRAPPSP